MRPQQNHVASLVNEAQRAQLAHLPLVDRRLEAEIELFESLDVGQVRQLQSRLEIALASRFDLRGQHVQQEVAITRLVLRGLLEQAFQPPLHGSQRQHAERFPEPFDNRHRPPPAATLS
jgi:hypothetical protein